ncbi:DUF4232 domain-containing protein [Streptomyces yunnanensis]|uniref:DUF4232 domain-containing protein n=1 Tax=Streptomyces yunnanensis TaxID=156453 RepID=A0ABY7ZZY0_9ACTN|nr:DUF4232 domain-containing protein [Streptomyces yunnanensis]WEB38073.1 DUF4232 domain-containing protein [Streptomyces yunnanensis]
MRTTTRKIAVTAAATALVGALGGGTAAHASSSTTATSADGNAAPSACRPANHIAKIGAAPATSGHRHYRVTLTAAPGYEPCRLAGSPTDVRFYHHGSLDGVTAGRYGPQHMAVTFGPGHPVHFDIQVPHGSAGAPADEATFTLRTPDGVIPGESSARGRLVVDAGTAIGPVRPGA